VRRSLLQRVSPLALLALTVVAGCGAPAVAYAQATNIDTAQPSYLASDLGTTVNPVFEGGVLKTDQATALYSQAFTLDGSGTNTIDAAGVTTTFSGVISDAGGTPGGITITDSAGVGGVTLTGASTYTGATTVSGGATLAISNSGSIASSSGVSLISARAQLDVSGLSSRTQIGALSGVAGSKVRLGAKGLTVDQVSATVFAGDILGSGSDAFIKTGVGTLTLSGANTYSNTTTISGGTLALAGAGAIGSSGLVDVAAGARFDISATDAGAAITRLSGAGDVALGGRTLTLTNANDTFSGAFSGAGGGLTIASGTQTLTGVSTHTGVTSIASGATLVLSGGGSIAGSTVAVDGAFDISATTSGAAVRSLAGSGDVILGSKTLTLTGGAATFSGEISGTGGLAVAGGSETLTSANSYTGGTTVSGGMLTLSGAGSLGAASGGLSISGGALNLGGTSQTVGNFTMTGGLLTGGGELTASSYNVQAGTIDVVLAGSGSLTQSGNGRTVLAAANTYTGGTLIMSGTLALRGAGTLGAAGGALTLWGGSLDLGGTQQTVGVLTLDGGAIVDSVGGGALTAASYAVRGGEIRAILAGSSRFTKSGSGVAVLWGVNTYDGATTVSGGTLALAGAGSIASSSQLDIAAGAGFDISNTDAGASVKRLSGDGMVALGARTLTLTGASDTFGGVIVGAGGLTVAGGAQTLTAASPYAGPTTVGRGAVLSLSGAGAIAASAVVADGTFDISGAPDGAVITSLSGGGSVVLGAENLVLTRAAGVFGGEIRGTGGLIVAGGAETLTGANSYAGGTRVTNAGLAIGGDAALGAAGGVLILDKGVLTVLRDTVSTRPILVTAGGGEIRAASGVVALGGAIVLDGVLDTGGPGKVVFSGVARGSGAVSIGDGMLVHNGEISAAGVTVATGGTLRGVGVIAAPTTVAGTLAPGASPGTLTFAGPVTLQATATSAFDIDGVGTGVGAGSYSRVIVDGADGRLIAGGLLAPRLRGITGSASNSFSPVIGQSFQVIRAAGGIAADSGFSGIAQPDGLMAGARFDAVYGATTLSLIVTPAAYADLGAAGVAASPNRLAVGAALDASRPAAGRRMSAAQASVYYPLYGSSAAELPAALESLSPDVYADGVMAVRQAWSQGAGVVSEQLAARRGAPGASDGITIWADVLAQRTDFEVSRASVGGVMFGVDRRFGDGLVGAAVGIDDVSADAKGGDHADGTMVQAVVYGAMQRGRAFVDWQAAYLRTAQDVSRFGGRFGAFAKGGVTLEGVGGRIDAGLTFGARRWRFEPVVGLSGLRLTSTAATEVGGVTAAEVETQRSDSLQSFVGARLAQTVSLTPDLSLQVRGLLGWSHELADADAHVRARLLELAGPTFTVSSARTGRDAAKLGLSVGGRLSSRVSVYGAYAAELARGRESQQVSVGVRAQW